MLLGFSIAAPEPRVSTNGSQTPAKEPAIILIEALSLFSRGDCFDARRVMTRTTTTIRPTEPAISVALRFLPVKEVVRRTSLSRATVYRLVQAGEFPKPVTLTGARTAWVETEVTAWMQARLAGRDSDRH